MVPRKGKGRKKWVAFGVVVVKDGRDWMTAAKNVGMWHRGVERERKHSITPGDARSFANPTCGASARLVNLYSSYVCVQFYFMFCLVAVVSNSWRRCPLLATLTPASFCLISSLFVCFVLFSPTVFVPGLFWYNFLYLVTTAAGFVADHLIV